MVLHLCWTFEHENPRPRGVSVGWVRLEAKSRGVPRCAGSLLAGREIYRRSTQQGVHTTSHDFTRISLNIVIFCTSFTLAAKACKQQAWLHPEELEFQVNKAKTWSWTSWNSKHSCLKTPHLLILRSLILDSRSDLGSQIPNPNQASIHITWICPFYLHNMPIVSNCIIFYPILSPWYLHLLYLQSIYLQKESQIIDAALPLYYMPIHGLGIPNVFFPIYLLSIDYWDEYHIPMYS